MAEIKKINIGTKPDDGTGDTLRDAFSKTNDNFEALNTLPEKGDKGDKGEKGEPGKDLSSELDALTKRVRALEEKNKVNSMSSLKSRLLAPDSYVEKHAIFDVDVYLRRLTIAELDTYEQALKQAQDSGSNTQASIAGANLILQTICDKAGQPLPTEELPTAEELIATKSTQSLIEALKFVQQFSCGSLDGAKKN